jgi:hypothetical protein
MPPRAPFFIPALARFGQISTYQEGYFVNRNINRSYGYDSYLYNQITPFRQVKRINPIFSYRSNRPA